MNNRITMAAVAAVLAAGWVAGVAYAAETNSVTHAPPVRLPEFRMPKVFGDNMVLQRDRPAPVWGWAAAGEEITVTVAGQKVLAKADQKGRWSATLAALAAGGPYEMAVSGRSRIAFTNVLVGEVWICSGQSNMEFPLRTALNGLERAARGRGELLSTQELAQAVVSARQAVAGCKDLNLRLMTVSQIDMKDPKYKDPQTDCGGSWVVCDEKTALEFSGTAFFFGTEIARELKVPVGLICSAFGGSGIGPWMPESEIVQGKDRSSRPSGVLYNGMIVPLMPYAMRGVIWYQGEADALGRNAAYRECMEALIGGWRKAWGQGDFPFYYVQIAPYSGYRWWQLWFWEMQAAAAQTLANCGMVVTADVDCNEDIHPPNKQPIGHRLALLALAKTYGRDGLVCSGPVYKSFAVEGGKIRIVFDGAAGGLASRDGKPIDLVTIAGEDRKFVPAKAEIDGETLVVSSEQVPKPVAVRYAARSGVFVSNLMNKSGLPAVPFRTDRW